MSSLKKSVFWGASSALFVIACQSILVILISRYLDPRLYGISASIGIMIGFTALFSDGGFNAAIVRAKIYTQRQKSSVKWFNFFLGSITSLTMSLIGIYYYTKDSHIGEAILIAALIPIIGSFGQSITGSLQRSFKMALISKIDLCIYPVNILVTGIFLHFGYQLKAVTLGVLSMIAIRVILLHGITRTNPFPKYKFRKRDISPFINFGKYQVAERITTYVSYRLDQILVGYFLGLESLGIYAFVWATVVTPLEKLKTLTENILIPTLARQTERKASKKHYYTTLSVLSITTAPLMIGVAALAPTLIPMFYEEDWIKAIPILQIFCLFAYFKTVYAPSYAMIQADGKSKLNFQWTLGYSLLSIPTIYLGSHFGGITGVASE